MCLTWATKKGPPLLCWAHRTVGFTTEPVTWSLVRSPRCSQGPWGCSAVQKEMDVEAVGLLYCGFLALQ